MNDDLAANEGLKWSTGGIGTWATLRAFHSGDRVAFIEGDRRITFADFDRRTDQLAHAFRASGIREGDRVAGLMVNSAAFLETMFATAKLGASSCRSTSGCPRLRLPTC